MKQFSNCIRAFIPTALILMPGALMAGDWISDPTRECQVFLDSDDVSGMTVAWSGSCADGKASGTGVLVVNDPKGLAAVFSGEMLQGKADGWGVIRFRNDDDGGYNVYIGGWEEGKPLGEGIFESSEGWELTGYFDGSFDSGEGTLTVYADEDGGQDAVIRGVFEKGELTGPAQAFYETENGEVYFGDIENSQRHGTGILVHANEDSYFGDFENGQASGSGVYEGADGSVTVGFFSGGSPNGAASYTAPNGDIYQGIFNNGTPDGLVLVTGKDGSQTTETWKDGEKQE